MQFKFLSRILKQSKNISMLEDAFQTNGLQEKAHRAIISVRLQFKRAVSQRNVASVLDRR